MLNNKNRKDTYSLSKYILIYRQHNHQIRQYDAAQQSKQIINTANLSKVKSSTGQVFRCCTFVFVCVCVSAQANRKR